MSTVTVNENSLISIADAIRTKGNTSAQLNFPDGFVGAIEAIPTGGGGIVPEKDINFIDYDGTVVAAYTLAELQNLTELPDTPAHDGLVSDGWNWTLEDLQADGKPRYVGALYHTADDKFHIYINIPVDGMEVCLWHSDGEITVDWGDGTEPETSDCDMTPPHQYNAGSYCITFPLGDLTAIGGDGSGLFFNEINFDAINSITRKIECPVGEYALDVCGANRLESIVGAGPDVAIFGASVDISAYIVPPHTENYGLWSGPTNKVAYAKDAIGILGGNTSIDNFCVPDAVTRVADYAFTSCTSLVKIELPSSVTEIGTEAFSYCQMLQNIEIPEGVTEIESMLCEGCNALKSFVALGDITRIGEYAFAIWDCLVYDFSHCTSVPTLEDINAFSGNPEKIIIVPDDLYDDWVLATNWSDSSIVDNIVKASEV